MRTIYLACLLAVTSCGDDGVSSPEDARNAYLGIDPSIDKAINLGFDGFNTASNANIAPQTATGTKTGMLTITGQVDNGVSSNKTMTLHAAYVSYSDNGTITYDTDPAALPALDMMFQNYPDGTVTGSFVGKVVMRGQETGDLNFNLMFTGQTQSGPNSTVVRTPGTTHITGTATSRYGTYTVDVTR